MSNSFTLLFLAALGTSVTVRLWLAYRHAHNIRTHRSAVPEEFAERVSLEAHQKAADYTLAKVRLGYVTLAIELAVLLGFTLGGGLATLADFWRARLEGIGYGLALIFSVLAISAVIDLPLGLWRQFVLEERFGFNRMTLKLFCIDQLKALVLALLIGTPVIATVLWLMKAMGSNWWLHVWLFWCVFNLLVLFIYPTWIAPLFNKFSPMEPGEVKSRVEALLSRCGFQSGGLFVMDGSKRSAHGNAYFTGFGQTKRIVFFDTLLNQLQPAEVEAVLAHELGHFRHRHIVKRITLMFALTLVFLAVLGQLIDAPWFYSGLGAPITGEHDTALALLLFFFVAPVFTFLFTPFGSMLSRRHEFEADRYAAANASAPDLVRALVKLYEDNASTLTPDPIHSLFYDSHPPAAIRIARLQATT